MSRPTERPRRVEENQVFRAGLRVGTRVKQHDLTGAIRQINRPADYLRFRLLPGMDGTHKFSHFTNVAAPTAFYRASGSSKSSPGSRPNPELPHFGQAEAAVSRTIFFHTMPIGNRFGHALRIRSAEHHFGDPLDQLLGLRCRLPARKPSPISLAGISHPTDPPLFRVCQCCQPRLT